jgi:hypothetical protein
MRKLNRINLLYFITYFLWSLAELSNTQSLKSMTSTLNSQYKSLALNRDPKYRTKSRELLKAYAANNNFFFIKYYYYYE